MYEYNPENIIVAWGETIFTGFGPDARVTAARFEDGVTMTVGNDGIPTATLNPNKTGSYTVPLMQGSETIRELLLANQIQENTGRLQKRPFSVTDLAGTILLSSPNAWLRKLADADFVKQAKEWPWIFDCDKLLYLPGAVIA